jgi:hypothetical protein
VRLGDAHCTASAHPEENPMKDTSKKSAAVPAAKTKGAAKPQKKERSELSQGELDKVSGGIRRVVKEVNGKKY